MRSTVKIASNSALNSILDNYSRVLKVQNQMSLGRRVVNPSDDPLAANEGMRLDTLIAKIGQYNNNITVGNSFLALSDSALGNVNDLVKKAKGLVIGGASETTTLEMRRTNAVEMNNLIQEIVNIGNTKSGNRYIFGGTQTQTPPFEVVGGRYVNYRGNADQIRTEVDNSAFMPINVTGETVFGSMISVLKTGDLDPAANMAVNFSTRLEDLNMGTGVPDGKLALFYSDFPANGQGLTIDLSAADTLEDVKDIIERETLAAGKELLATNTRYVRVDINSNGTGLMLREWDAAVDLPAGTGASALAAPTTPLEARESANNTVAQALGLKQTGAIAVDPFYGGNVNSLNGFDTNPRLTEQTLLADLAGYSDAGFVITNGGLPGNVQINELDDTNNRLDGWSLTGLAQGVNTGESGELYATVGYDGANYTVQLYKDKKRLAGDLIASGTSPALGTIVMQEQNASGVSGTLSLNYPAVVGTEDLSMKTIYDPTFRSTVSVPAFIESNDANNQFEAWSLRGLDKGVSTDANGQVYVRMTTIAGARQVQIYRDAAMAPADLVAQGTLPAGQTQGQVTLSGIAPDFQGVSGSVYLEYSADVVAADNLTVQATFAKVGDFCNAIKSSNTYTTARVAENGKGLEIVSTLGGAYLNVALASGSYARSNDDQGAGGNPQLSQVNLPGLTADINADRNSQVYVEIQDTGVAGPQRYMVRVYSDSAHTNLVASGGRATASGVVGLTEQNQSGLVGGSVFLNYNADDNDIVMQPRALPLTGRAREPNIFSTFNDSIDAMNGNDAEALSELVDNYKTDSDRILMGRADVGSRMERIELIMSRHEDEQVNFNQIRADRIDLDYAEAIVRYQSAQNIFEASLRTTAQFIPLSLVDYI